MAYPQTHLPQIHNPETSPLAPCWRLGTTSEHCLTCANVFICFYKIVLFSHRQSKEHIVLSARLAVTIILTFTVSTDKVFAPSPDVTYHGVDSFILCISIQECQQNSTNCLIFKERTSFVNYSNFPSANQGIHCLLNLY